MLYRRSGRRLELTAEGRRVAAFGREMRERAKALEAELGGGAGGGTVVLAAGAGAYLYLLGGAIQRFVARGEAQLRLLTLDGPQAIESVRAGTAHLGVAALLAPPEDLEARMIARVEQVLVVPKGHPLEARKRVALKDLEGARLIVPPEGRPQRIAIAQAFHAARIQYEVAVEAVGWELTLHFAKLGLGLAIVNSFCRLPAGLVARPLSGLPPTDYYLFHRRQALFGPAEALATTLRQR